MISINNLMFFFGKKNKEKTNIYNLIKKSKNKYKEYKIDEKKYGKKLIKHTVWQLEEYKTIEKKLKKSLKG